MGWRFPLLSVWAVLVLLNFLVASPFPGGHESRPAAFRRALVAARTEPAPSDPGRRGAVAANVVRQLATTGLALAIVAALSGWGSAVVSWLRAGSLGVP